LNDSVNRVGEVLERFFVVQSLHLYVRVLADLICRDIRPGDLVQLAAEFLALAFVAESISLCQIRETTTGNAVVASGSFAVSKRHDAIILHVAFCTPVCVQT